MLSLEFTRNKYGIRGCLGRVGSRRRYKSRWIKISRQRANLNFDEARVGGERGVVRKEEREDGGDVSGIGTEMCLNAIHGRE